jgi:L,D-peptidoglycan transpeptidase YkuD (ErfK/YbiS/YcfS/YnhG family)
MRLRLLVPALVALAVTGTGLSSAAHADIRYVELGGVRVGLHERTTQVVTVNHTRGYHARVAFWQWSDGRWRRVYAVRDGRIGYGGLVRPHRRQQGSGTTPLGTTKLLSAFGRHSRAAAWDLPYRRIRKGDYWVEDNGSGYYNRYRNKANGGFRWWLPASDVNSSERLRDYPVQYEYSIVTSYNRSQVRHRGAGIFLHVNGRGATAGCVSAPRWFLRRMMRVLDPAQVPEMAVGR